MPGAGLLEPVDGVLGYVDYHKNLLLGILVSKRVVRLVPRILQVDERFSEAVDLQWKRPHHPLLPTCAPGLSVLKGTVHLMPFRAAAGAGEQIRGGAGQAVEQCVEGRIVDGFAVRRSGYSSPSSRHACTCSSTLSSALARALSVARASSVSAKNAEPSMCRRSSMAQSDATRAAFPTRASNNDKEASHRSIGFPRAATTFAVNASISVA